MREKNYKTLFPCILVATAIIVVVIITITTTITITFLWKYIFAIGGYKSVIFVIAKHTERRKGIETSGWFIENMRNKKNNLDVMLSLDGTAVQLFFTSWYYHDAACHFPSQSYFYFMKFWQLVHYIWQVLVTQLGEKLNNSEGLIWQYIYCNI